MSIPYLRYMDLKFYHIRSHIQSFPSFFFIFYFASDGYLLLYPNRRPWTCHKEGKYWETKIEDVIHDYHGMLVDK